MIITIREIFSFNYIIIGKSLHNQGDFQICFIRTWKTWFILRELSAESGRVGVSIQNTIMIWCNGLKIWSQSHGGVDSNPDTRVLGHDT